MRALKLICNFKVLMCCQRKEDLMQAIAASTLVPLGITDRVWMKSPELRIDTHPIGNSQPLIYCMVQCSTLRDPLCAIVHWSQTMSWRLRNSSALSESLLIMHLSESDKIAECAVLLPGSIVATILEEATAKAILLCWHTFVRGSFPCATWCAQEDASSAFVDGFVDYVECILLILKQHWFIVIDVFLKNISIISGFMNNTHRKCIATCCVCGRHTIKVEFIATYRKKSVLNV